MTVIRSGCQPEICNGLGDEGGRLTSSLAGPGYRAGLAAKAGTFAGSVGTVSATVVGGGVGEGIEDLLQMRIWPG